MVNIGISDLFDRGIDKIMDIEYYSNITILFRVIAYVIRFVNNFKRVCEDRVKEI